MSLEIINENEEKVSVKIKGVPLQYANALRRICLNGVPIYAVESVDMLENSSVLADEGVAHRVGLIPLKTDLESSKAGNENDKIMLTLDSGVSDETRTITVGIATFVSIGLSSSFGILMTSAFVASFPAILFFLLLQRYLEPLKTYSILLS